MLVLNAGLIALQPLDCNSLFAIIQELGRYRRIRHEDANDNSPKTAQSADDDEFVSPRRQSTINVADRIAEKATQSNPGPVGGIPEADT